MLTNEIDTLKELPYRFRKSIYYADEAYRDMIIKGFTIIYKIDDEISTVKILGVYRSKNF